MTFFNVNVRGKSIGAIIGGIIGRVCGSFGGSYLGTLSVDKAYGR